MASLLDIAPLVDHVDVRGTTIEVRGVSARGVAQLLYRFPKIRKMWATSKWDVATIMEMGDEVVAALIAASLSHPGDPEYEAAAGRLALGEQAEIMAKSLKLTMPNGFSRFSTALTEAMGAVNAGAAPTALKSTSRKRSQN